MQAVMTIERVIAYLLTMNEVEMASAVQALAGQLPERMEHCKILFKECAKGHGWLTAENWVQHDCPTCERDALRKALDQLLCAVNAQAITLEERAAASAALAAQAGDAKP